MIVRNVLHLGIGQIATTALGFILTAALARSLGPSNLGIYYIIFTVSGFASILVDWGQGTYMTAELARGRPDEPEFIGSALLIRAAGTGCAAVLAAAIALACGYEKAIIWLAPIAALVGLPFALSQPFSFLFRGRDRMDLDACVAIIGKALTLAATLLALRWGATLIEILLAQGIGGIGSLAAGVFLARRLGLKVKAPASNALRDLLWSGAPIAIFGFALALQQFVEVLLLSRLTSPEVVGWFAAARTVLGIVISPAAIIALASFPEVARVSASVPDLHRVLAESSRLLLSIGAFACSALYVFADHIIAIIYGKGDFQQAALILRASAPFLPLLFLGFLLGNATAAIGKTKEIALAKIGCIVIGAAVAYVFVGVGQARFGNGALAIVIWSGIAEIFMLVTFVALLPRGAVTYRTLRDLLLTLLVLACTILPFLKLQSLSLWLMIPMFVIIFTAVAMVLRLILPADLQRVAVLLRNRGAALRRPQV